MAAINPSQPITSTLPPFKSDPAANTALPAFAMPTFEPATTKPTPTSKPNQPSSSKIQQFLKECAILEANATNAKTMAVDAKDLKEKSALTVPSTALATKKVERFNYKSIINLMNRISQELLVQAGDEANHESTLFSSFSLVQVLVAILDGFSDEKLKELGLTDEDLDSINDGLKVVTDKTCTKGTEAPFVQSFNALVTSFPITSAYQKMAKEKLGMEFFSLKEKSSVTGLTASTAAPKADNESVKGAVVELIRSKVNDASMKTAICDAAKQMLSKIRTDALLINLLIFKADWVTPFEYEGDSYFHSMNGDRISAKIMGHYHKSFGVVFAKDYRAVILDYKVDAYPRKLRDVQIIPNDPQKLNEIARKRVEIINHIFKSHKHRKLHFFYPEQTFNHEVNLGEKLQKLGVNLEVNLSRMSDERATLTSLTQQIVGSKDKKGTKFVVATYGGISRSGRDNSLPYCIDVNRPFISETFTLNHLDQDDTPLLTTRIVDNRFLTPGKDQPIKQNPFIVEDLDIEAFQKENGTDWNDLYGAIKKTVDLDDDPQSAKVFTTDNNTKLYVVNFTEHEFSFNRYREAEFKGQLLYCEVESDKIPKDPNSNNWKKYYIVQDYSPTSCLVFVYEKDGTVCFRDKDLGSDVLGCYNRIDEGEEGDPPIVFETKCK